MSQILLIKKLAARPISFHRAFVPITGGVTSALMLSQAVYWSDRTNDPKGWFYKTAAEWEEETGMTRREQETARRQLKETGFWQEELRGLPAKMFYRIDFENLQTSLAESAILDKRKQTNRSGENSQTFLNSTEITTETTTEITIAADAAINLGSGKKKKKSADPAFKPCVDLWLTGIHAGWTFSAVHGKSLKSILTKIRAYGKSRNADISDARVVEFFQVMCRNLPEWFKDKDLQVIDSKFNEIITQIENGRNNRSQKANGQTRTYDPSWIDTLYNRTPE